MYSQTFPLSGTFLNWRITFPSEADKGRMNFKVLSPGHGRKCMLRWSKPITVPFLSEEGEDKAGACHEPTFPVGIVKAE